MTREVWRVCSKRFGLFSQSSSMTSFLFHPAIPVSISPAFRPWFEKGLFLFADIVDYRTHKIHTFESLQSIFSLPKECYYSYMQISSYLRKSLSSAVVSLPTDFERLCKVGPATKGLRHLSHSVRPESNHNPPPPRHSYVDKWDVHFVGPISMDTWRRIWKQAIKISLCISHRENQFIILMHWYHTPSLHKLNPAISELCWRCLGSIGTQYHVFWECTGIRSF